MLAWLQTMVETAGYPGLILAVTLESLYPPIPSEVILPFAGFMVARGVFTLGGCILTATLGSVLSALVFYGIGRMVPKPALFEFVGKQRRWLPISQGDLEKASAWFSERGTWAVLIGRIVPVVRHFVSIPAGMAAMPILPFVAYTAIGSTVWNVVLVGSGMLLGAHWDSVQSLFATYQYPALLAVAAGILLVLVWRKGRVSK